MYSVTLTPNLSGGDGEIPSWSSVYSNAANGTGSITTDTTSTTMTLGQWYRSDIPRYSCHENFFKFDTSVIPNGSQIHSATLSLYITGKATAGSEFTANVYNSAWSKPLATGDFITPATLSGLDVVATLDSSTVSTSARNSFTGNLAKYIDVTGYTDFVIASDRHVSETTPTDYEAMYAITVDLAGSNKPNLVIEYSLPGMFGNNF